MSLVLLLLLGICILLYVMEVYMVDLQNAVHLSLTCSRSRCELVKEQRGSTKRCVVRKAGASAQRIRDYNFT